MPTTRARRCHCCHTIRCEYCFPALYARRYACITTFIKLPCARLKQNDAHGTAQGGIHGEVHAGDVHEYVHGAAHGRTHGAMRGDNANWYSPRGGARRGIPGDVGGIIHGDFQNNIH